MNSEILSTWELKMASVSSSNLLSLAVPLEGSWQ